MSWIDNAKVKTLAQRQAEEMQANKEARITELKKLLSDSDHKDLPSYKPKQHEVIIDIINQRDKWREEIRSLQS